MPGILTALIEKHYSCFAVSQRMESIMTVKKNIQNPMMALDWIKDAYEYGLDSIQR